MNLSASAQPLFTRLTLVGLAVVLTFAALLQAAPRASAAPPTPAVVAVAPATSAHMAATGTVATAATAVSAAAAPMAWSDCRRIAAGYPHPAVKVIKALAYWKCAPTIVGAAGKVSADTICWGSRQWWGGPLRWVVWMITGGQYNKC